MSERNPDHCYDCGIYIGGKPDDHYCLNCAKDRRQQESEGVVVEVWFCTECRQVSTADEDGCCTDCGKDCEPCKARLTRIEGEG